MKSVRLFMFVNYNKHCKIIKVIDADTVYVDIDLGFSVWHKTRLRLFGINAPELNTPEGREAKAYLTEFLEDQVVMVETIKTKADKDKLDKYGRYLGILFVETVTDAGDITRFNVNDHLVEKGHAVRM